MEKLPFELKKQGVYTKKESDGESGYRPEERSVEELIQYGIINLNKPSGPTSHQVSDYVQRILNIKKSGHTGTLDPKVTGVLPIALAKATRIVQALIPAGKEYIALMHLHKNIDEDKLLKVIEKFHGKIKQVPPLKSAVKRIERTREVYYFNILEIQDQDILFKVGCEAGTYIRKLIHDLGKEIGTGAHMTQLVRTKAGPFTDHDWHSLQDLRDAYEFYKEGKESEIRNVILPYEKAVQHLPKIWVFDNVISNLCHGSSLGSQGISKLTTDIKKDDLIAILTLKDELICLAKADLDFSDIIKEEKLLAASPVKVFMDFNRFKN
ncbi:MAG: RNA-guided pseudouridylation complex pseudouridine synthase subunit Cbf5 [Nanoarchaeota archaeon]